MNQFVLLSSFGDVPCSFFGRALHLPHTGEKQLLHFANSPISFSLCLQKLWDLSMAKQYNMSCQNRIDLKMKMHLTFSQMLHYI